MWRNVQDPSQSHQLTLNQRVHGSSPCVPTIEINDSTDILPVLRCGPQADPSVQGLGQKRGFFRQRASLRSLPADAIRIAARGKMRDPPTSSS